MKSVRRIVVSIAGIALLCSTAPVVSEASIYAGQVQPWSSNSSSEWGGTHSGNLVEVRGSTKTEFKSTRPSNSGRNESGSGTAVGVTDTTSSDSTMAQGLGAETAYTWRHLCADNSSGNISIACAVAAPDVCPPGEYYGAILSIDAAGVASETGSYGCTGGATAAAAPAGGNAGATGTTAPPVVIVVTAADFQRLVIPPSTIRLDTGGNTLRTAHTNIYANAGVKMLNTTVLGQPVRVRAIPIEYIWDYGDGTTRRTWKPGEAIGGDPFDVETETSHQFEETGSFPINLTTVYTGQFSVNGGPWIPIDGVARVSSAPESMEVWKTKRYLVAEDCIANPEAIGCTDG